MDKEKGRLIEYALVVVLAIAIAAIMAFILFRSNLNVDVAMAPDYTLIDNPLMGFAPDAANSRLCENSKLVYITLRWADWEPSDGKYDIEGLEKKYHIARWKEENKHAVLRFVCDVPTDEKHEDIPGWLLGRVEGTYYSNTEGKGYSPDYSNEVFIKYHTRAIEELAKYCNRDHFVAFVEVGSIGHNGKWIAYNSNGKTLMPDSHICFDYASLYSNNFMNARLLIPKNYDFAVDGKLGYFNDNYGNATEIANFVDELKKDGSQETQGTALTLKRAEGYGRRTPIAGDIAADVSMNDLMGDELGNLLASISSSNMTYLGPNLPDIASNDNALAAESIVKRMGYRIYVSRLKTQYDFSNNKLNTELTFSNAGGGGFFFDWPVTVYVYDGNKKLIYWEGIPLDLTQLGLSDTSTASLSIPMADEIRDEFYIGVGITDYEGKDNVKLAIDTEEEKEYIDGVQLIYHFVRNG